MPCAFTPPPSPTSPAIISTITALWRPMGRPRRASSASPASRTGSSTSMTPSARALRGRPRARRSPSPPAPRTRPRCRAGRSSCAPCAPPPIRQDSTSRSSRAGGRSPCRCASWANSTSTTSSPCSRYCSRGASHPRRRRAPSPAAARRAGAWRCSAAAGRARGRAATVPRSGRGGRRARGAARMKRTLIEFARACGGRLSGADAPYTDVVSDSRSLERGQLFVALKGPRFNGNEFVAAAHGKGAAGALVDAGQPVPLPQVIVPDTQAALERAAGRWRAAFRGPLIGVAGSNGKTTTKEMTASILAQAGSCLATRGNLNNHIGVPLTLLRLEPTHRFAVVEMGTNHPGEVAALVDMARPTIGLITNAGAEHLEGFGSLEGVARAEGEMVAGLAEGATAVINADDEFAPLWRSLTPARVLTFGVRTAADYSAAEVRGEVGAEGFSTRFRLNAPGGSIAIHLAVGGLHNVANALAAAAAAGSAGVGLEQIAAGLAAVRAVSGRLQFRP